MDCIFCKIAAGEVPATILYEDDDVLAFEDLNPQAPHHYLIIPRQHIATVNDFEPAHQGTLGSMLLAARQVAANQGIAENGYRLVMNCGSGAGQSVFHVHLHLLAGRGFSWPPG